MTHKEEAIRLVEIYWKQIYYNATPVNYSKLISGKPNAMLAQAKACALIHIDELLKELDNLHKPEYTTFRVYDEVQMNGYELKDHYESVKEQIQML